MNYIAEIYRRVLRSDNKIHSGLQWYGLTSNAMARKSVAPIVVTGGSGAYGTELLLTDGTVIESGNTTKKFMFSRFLLASVGTADRYTAMEFYANSLSAAVAGVTAPDTANTITKATHGLVNGQKLILSSIVDTTGINAYTVYYVVNKDANTFQLSLTVGGAAVTMTTAGTCNYQVLTQTLLTDHMVNGAATTTDAFEQQLSHLPQVCNKPITCRAWSASGTNAISFFLGVTIYPSY